MDLADPLLLTNRMDRSQCGLAEPLPVYGVADPSAGHRPPDDRQSVRVVLVTAGGTVDITEAAAAMLHRARSAVADPCAPHTMTGACPAAWSLVCRHLGYCNGGPHCPALDHTDTAQADDGVSGPARKPIVVTLASARPDAHAGLRGQLALEPDIAWTEAPDLAFRHLAAHGEDGLPDVLVVDQSLCDPSSLCTIADLRARKPDLRVVVSSDDASAALCATIVRHRFHGLLLSHCASAVGVKALRAVLRGELWLPRAVLGQLVAERNDAVDNGVAPKDAGTPSIEGALTDRQAQIVAHLRQGFTNKEIARQLGIQEDTVKKHLQAVFGKLGVHRRALVALGGAAAWAGNA